MSDIKNYFELFQLPVQIPVDIANLTLQYQQLQRQYHPDNFATANKAVRRQMLQQSADINDAYQILKDPICSAEYLLTLNGIIVSVEENIINDVEFLMEQFKLREQLDTIQDLIDDEQKEHTLQVFAQSIKQEWQQTQQQLFTSITQSAWQDALAKINKLRFLTKLQQQIDKLEEQLFDI